MSNAALRRSPIIPRDAIPGGTERPRLLKLAALNEAEAVNDPPPKSWAEEELLAALARGDLSALEHVYDRFSTLMFSVALRMLGSRSAAEDLVHDVFLEAWRASSSFDPRRGTLRTWLMVRLRSRALDRLRSAGQTRRVDTGGEDLPEPKTVPAEDPELSPDRQAVRGVVAELPTSQRQVIELAYFSGLSASEIAVRVGIPVGTVKSRTAKALSWLRTEVATGGAA